MNRILLKLNLKIILKSPVFYFIISIITAGNLALTLLFKANKIMKFINFIFLFNNLSYMDYVMFALLFCFAMFHAQKKTTLENVCFVPRYKSLVYKFLSLILISLWLCVLPALFVIINGIIENTGIGYILLCLLYVLIRWLMIIFVAQSLGFVTGCLISGVYAYLFAIPFTILFTNLNENIFSILFKYDYENIYKFSYFFSVMRSFVNGVDIEYRGPVVNAELIAKFFSCLLVAAAAIFFIKMISDRKIKIVSVFMFVLSMSALGVMCAVYLNLFPVRYEDTEKLYILDYKQQPYEITSYSGDINLKEWSDYSISVGIKKTGEADGLTLRLDQSMKIKSLDIDGKDVDYKRFGDILEIDCNKEEFTLNLSCGGRISYVNNVNSTNIYTSYISCALPPEFAFLPKIDGDKSKKQYDLSVKSNNTLISNLDFNKENGVYKLSGSSQNMCLFSGFLTQTEIDGITFYHAKYNVTTDYYEVYNIYRENSNMIFDPERNEIVKEKWPQKPKVFMIAYMYGTAGFAVPYDDYVMINYGFVA